MQEEGIPQAAVNSFKVTHTLHTIPQSGAWFGSTHLYRARCCPVLLPFHHHAGANEQHKGHADSQAMANMGLNGAPSFIAAALPRHRDNSKQFSDAGVEAHNGDKKQSSQSQ